MVITSNNSLADDVKTSQHATRYFFVGVGVTIFNYILFTILSNLIIKDNNLLWLSSLIATVITTIVAYIAHSKITWKERHVAKSSIIRFFVWNALLAIIISPALTQLFSFLTPLYGFAYNIATAIHLPFNYEFILTTGVFVLTSLVIMILNFLFYDRFVFPKSQRNKSSTFHNSFPNIKVSVIIPVYNTAKNLSACLNSILNSTHQNLEVICINDGSTDNSPIILKNYAKKDPRIKIITQKNQGLSAARNAGLKIATGNYITFVDSDDIIEPIMIEAMVKAVQSSKADVAACSFKEIYSNGKIKLFNQNYPQKIYNTEEALRAILLEKGFMLSSTMKLFPKNYFKNIKFPVGKLHEDVDTTYRLILKADKIIFLPEAYYIYIHNDNSIIKSGFDDRKLDLIIFTDKMCDAIDHKYPNLKNVTNERRMRARFSILRQIPTTHPETKTLLKYLKTHQSYITKNPEATKSDKVALKLALTNVKLFQLAYKLFK